MPRGLLRDSQVAMQLHRAHALQTGGNEINGYRPVLVTDMRAVHDRVDPDGEVAPAGPAEMRLTPVLSSLIHVRPVAVRAADSLRPPVLDEPFLGRAVVGEHLEEFW